VTQDQTRICSAIITLSADIDRLLAELQDTTDSQKIYEACKRVRSALR
jgi:hypothetical protein